MCILVSIAVNHLVFNVGVMEINSFDVAWWLKLLIGWVGMWFVSAFSVSNTIYQMPFKSRLRTFFVLFGCGLISPILLIGVACNRMREDYKYRAHIRKETPQDD